MIKSNDKREEDIRLDTPPSSKSKKEDIKKKHQEKYNDPY